MSLGEPTIQQSLRTYIASLPEVVELCGDRVFPRWIAPGEPLPAITITTISHPRLRTLDAGPCGMGNPRVQIDIWARSEAEAKQLEWAIRGTKQTPRLDGFTGTMGSHNIQSAEVEDVRDMDEPAEHGEEQGVCRVSMDVVLWYDE